MMRQLLDVTLRGTSPIVMHSGVLLDPLNPISVELATYNAKLRKSVVDHRHISDLEFLGGLWTVEGRPCVPGRTIEAALRQAAERRGVDRRRRTAIVVEGDAVLQYPGPRSVDELKADSSFRLRAPVVIDGHRRTRTRPIFRLWSLTSAIGYEPDLISRADLIDLAILAGDEIGIGDGRPKYGRFTVVPA